MNKGVGYLLALFIICVRCGCQLHVIGVRADDGAGTQNATSDTLPTIVKSDELEPSVTNTPDSLDSLNKQVFSEVASQNSGIANNIINNDQPVVLTLSDPATAELENRAEISSVATDPHPKVAFQNKSQDNDASQKNRSDPELNEQKNRTVEEIPSFSEWAQKRLEEAEKREQVNTSAQNGSINNKPKLRWKNYASLDCGAKVIASNPEATSPWAILSPSRDEYKLNKCTNRIWFVVELCESIQAKKIDLANYELFSSSPKDFTVSVSDRFPTRDWSFVGQFTAKDERDIQSFELEPQIFGKYIKVEVKSHYGSEHYCPISLFRVYGINVFEVLQKEDPAHENRDDDEDDDETLDTVNDSSKNLFVSATDAVISIVKKAAQVLGNKANETSETIGQLKYSPLIHSCTTPSHLVVCNNCSDTLFGQIYELLSCKSVQINNLVSIPFIRKTLKSSIICNQFGFDFKNKSLSYSTNACSDCLRGFFHAKYLAAMCNTVAIIENKVVLNMSLQYNNVTEQHNATSEDKLVNIAHSEVKISAQEQDFETEDVSSVFKQTDPLILQKTETLVPDSSISSKIKPTKALTSDAVLDQLNTDQSTLVLDTSTTSGDWVQPSETAEKYEDVKTVTETPIIDVPDPVDGDTIENMDELLDINEDNAQSNNFMATTASTPPGQKESVFLRLSNRIKALERNMSLSGQYLEELSKRYKKQVEEMQTLLEKTLNSIEEENQRKEARNDKLEKRLDQLTKSVELLLAERNTFFWSFWISTFALTGLAIYTFCRKRNSVERTETVPVHRRKSIDIVQHNPVAKKRRRPSDQVLKIVRNSCTSNADNKQERRRRKKVRSNSPHILNEEKPARIVDDSANKDWVEDLQGQIEDVPFALDEMEHSTLEGVPIALEIAKEVPEFMQTAATMRLNRSSSQNGAVGKDKKSISLDESQNKYFLQTVNGGAEDAPKKEKRGFKKLLKKVF